MTGHQGRSKSSLTGALFLSFSFLLGRCVSYKGWPSELQAIELVGKFSSSIALVN